MKYFVVLIVIGLWSQFNKIADTNAIKSEAEKAYLSKNYDKAIELYQRLLTTFQLEDEKIRLNFAHALFLNEKKKEAMAEYQMLTTSTNHQTSSIAFQQLGVIAASKGKFEISLVNFQQALKTNPLNENARYNYELIKKIRDQELSLHQTPLKSDTKESENKQEGYQKGNQQEKDRQVNKYNPDGNQTTQKGEKQEGGNLLKDSDNGDLPKNTQKKDPLSNDPEKELDIDKKGNKDKEALKTKRLKEINISEEKAKMILDLMKSEEIQYIQQRKRNDQNKEYKNKPDW